MTLYLISGLGADERVFEYLNLPGVRKKVIPWITPLKNESMTSYARRLSTEIDTSTPVLIAGLSFGGMLAIEISRMVPCQKLIVISSAKSLREYGWFLLFLRKSRLYKVIPVIVLKYSNKISLDYFFGAKSKEDSRLLHDIINYTDKNFLRWAINTIMKWQPPEIPVIPTHIHGTKDRIFPPGNIRNAQFVEDGGHFMVVNKHEEVSRLLLQAISNGE